MINVHRCCVSISLFLQFYKVFWIMNLYGGNCFGNLDGFSPAGIVDEIGIPPATLVGQAREHLVVHTLMWLV